MRFRNFFAAAALVLGLALPGRAVDIMITVNGTINSADAGMGYTVGDLVSFTWVVNDYAPATPVGTFGTSDYTWKQEFAGTEPALWANVYGTGIGGTFNEPPAGAPFERLIVSTSTNNLELRMGTDGFDVTTNNHGIYLNANPSYLIETIYFQNPISAVFGNFGGPLPNPTTYLANYFGTYSVLSDFQFYLSAKNGTSVLFADITPTSVTIAPVPEPSTCILGGLAMGVMGVMARRRKARRQA